MPTPAKSFMFTDAVKAGSYARIALAGPSGSGKTWTALTIARGLGGSVGLIDTERGSARKYAGPFRFRHLQMNTFDPNDLIAAVAAAGDQGINVLVIDSMSHFWMGADGMLEQVDRAARRAAGGNQFGGWKEMRPTERAMIDALLAYPGHIIVTMRTKTEWVVETDDRGKKVPRKIGLKPEQREGMEYEFDIVGDMDLDNVLSVTKSRCPELSAAVIAKPTEDLGETVAAWLTDAAVGEPFNAREARDWAIDPYRTFGEIRARYDEIKAAGQLGAVVVNATGDTVTIGDLLVERGHEAKAIENARATAPAAA